MAGSLPAVPANSVLLFDPGRGHFLLQEGGVSLGSATNEADLDSLVGETVVEIRGDQVVFEAGTKPAPRLFARVEIAPECADRGGGPLSLPDLVGRSVASASTKDGVLSFVFADGATLRCEPDRSAEAWQVGGGHPLRLIVCRAGGELSVWDETPPIPYGQLRERDPATAEALDKLLQQCDLPPPVGFPPPESKRGRLSRWRNRVSASTLAWASVPE
jgi:hypothetical protein